MNNSWLKIKKFTLDLNFNIMKKVKIFEGNDAQKMSKEFVKNLYSRVKSELDGVADEKKQFGVNEYNFEYKIDDNTVKLSTVENSDLEVMSFESSKLFNINLQSDSYMYHKTWGNSSDFIDVCRQSNKLASSCKKISEEEVEKLVNDALKKLK